MKIEFIPSDENTRDFIVAPKPAKLYTPQWYKDLLPVNKLEPKFDKDHNLEKTVKHCMPFFDAMTMGYIQEAWCDIYIKIGPDGFEYHTSSHFPILNPRDKTAVPIPEKYYPVEFTWVLPWIPKTPKGWSVLITDPLNSIDRPFKTLSGVIDSDNFYHAPNGNLPFYLDKDFVGMIEAGTPLFQIIPFKRESWTSEIVEVDDREVIKRENLLKRKFSNIYKNNFWVKKEYN